MTRRVSKNVRLVKTFAIHVFNFFFYNETFSKNGLTQFFGLSQTLFSGEITVWI